jgi:hypothetical protein
MASTWLPVARTAESRCGNRGCSRRSTPSTWYDLSSLCSVIRTLLQGRILHESRILNQPLLLLQGHTSTVNSVRYLPCSNNEYIVTASNDKEAGTFLQPAMNCHKSQCLLSCLAADLAVAQLQVQNARYSESCCGAI